jgi:cation transport regulator
MGAHGEPARRDDPEATMPYQSRSDLPESVRDNLPPHAQDIYKAAFNSAWDEYGHDESRAHRVAWGAVEHEYHKDSSGKWVKGATQDDSAH